MGARLRHQWVVERGGRARCAYCGSVRVRQERVVSSVYGQTAVTTYWRGADRLARRPECVDTRQGDLFSGVDREEEDPWATKSR